MMSWVVSLLQLLIRGATVEHDPHHSSLHRLMGMRTHTSSPRGSLPSSG
jgi:hypothetical protein